MINSLWISKTGMEAQQMQLDVISNNLANVSTNGFKKSHAVFEDLMYQNLRQVGSATSEQATLPTGLQIGLGVRTVATSRNFSQGNLQQSNNNLDVAVQGNGFFQVTMPDGTTGYTRDGAFQIDNAGRLVTSGGLLLSGGITVPANATSLTISQDGAVAATIPGNVSPQSIGTITTANFINPAGLEPKGQNIYAESAASGQPTVGTPSQNGLGPLMQGFVETSNVNVVQELVTMIQTQRAYEMNSKAIQTSDQMLQKLGQL
ncbi:MAG: flagellar basal-body rod protein FlgG [Rhodoferax sp.]|nr:flagellar basal-body rod protein FlgG [Rhodoferax sp.]